MHVTPLIQLQGQVPVAVDPLQVEREEGVGMADVTPLIKLPGRSRDPFRPGNDDGGEWGRAGCPNLDQTAKLAMAKGNGSKLCNQGLLANWVVKTYWRIGLIPVNSLCARTCPAEAFGGPALGAGRKLDWAAAAPLTVNKSLKSDVCPTPVL